MAMWEQILYLKLSDWETNFGCVANKFAGRKYFQEEEEI
jgi:hypothetical protein